MTNPIRRPAAVLFVSFSVWSFTACSSGGGNSTSASSGATPAVVTPSVTSISPAKLPAGSPATSLVVTGTDFIAMSAVQVGGVVEPTTYGSAKQLTASVPASQLASGAELPVIVLNSDSTSASGPVVNLEIDNPAPAITSLVPATFTVGSASRTVSITGSGFVPASTVQINGTSRSTTFVTSTQLNVIFTAADLAVGAAPP